MAHEVLVVNPPIHFLELETLPFQPGCERVDGDAAAVGLLLPFLPSGVMRPLEIVVDEPLVLGLRPRVRDHGRGELAPQIVHFLFGRGVRQQVHSASPF